MKRKREKSREKESIYILVFWDYLFTQYHVSGTTLAQKRRSELPYTTVYPISATHVKQGRPSLSKPTNTLSPPVRHPPKELTKDSWQNADPWGSGGGSKAEPAKKSTLTVSRCRRESHLVSH